MKPLRREQKITEWTAQLRDLVRQLFDGKIDRIEFGRWSPSRAECTNQVNIELVVSVSGPEFCIRIVLDPGNESPGTHFPCDDRGMEGCINYTMIAVERFIKSRFPFNGLPLPDISSLQFSGFKEG
jgi:hypothetical protein